VFRSPADSGLQAGPPDIPSRSPQMEQPGPGFGAHPQTRAFAFQSTPSTQTSPLKNARLYGESGGFCEMGHAFV